MKAENLHLQYKPDADRVLLVNHGSTPMAAFDCHEEFLYCVAAWGLRSSVKPRKLNAVERLFKYFGIRVVQASGVREIATKSGTLRVTVEHAT